jgi:polyisoprenoid-binding protein YceI
MKTHIALLAVATALTATAHAEKIAFDLKDPKGVNNIVFKLDAPLESINGTANGITGTVLIDPAQPEVVEGKIVVDTKSLVVPNSVMQEHMLGADWLDAETHPQITFEVKEVLNPVKSSDTEGTADVKGTFTLKGVSKEITAPAKVTYLPGRLADRTNGQMQGDLLVIRTNFQINRGDFGIKAGESLDKVSDTIDVSLSIAGSAPKP